MGVSDMQTKTWSICCIFWLITTFMPGNGWAWNMIGHKVIAEIAYRHLTPTVQQRVMNDLRLLTPYYRSSQFFSSAAAWADQIKFHDVHAYDAWHYIDLPSNLSPSKGFAQVDRHNVVWAIGQSAQVVGSHHSTPFEKALFLHFLIHFVGDIHQPLHCISLVSQQFPSGDKGGNLFYIRGVDSDNLHHYWDQGAGILVHLKRYRQIEAFATDIEADYPRRLFVRELAETDPKAWALASYQQAKENVYVSLVEGQITRKYQERAQKLSRQQIALAGYRLALMLNALYDER